MKSFHLEKRNFRQSKIANCSPYFITLQVINNIEAEESYKMTVNLDNLKF